MKIVPNRKGEPVRETLTVILKQSEYPDAPYENRLVLERWEQLAQVLTEINDQTARRNQDGGHSVKDEKLLANGPLTVKSCCVLTCCDEGLQTAKKLDLPAVAFRCDVLEEQIGRQELFDAAILCERREDANLELLEMARCRKLGIPLCIGTSRRLRFREIGAEDIPMLFTQTGGVINGFGLHPQVMEWEEFRNYWTSYIESMYPFYGFGLYLLELMEEHPQVIGMAGFQIPDYEEESKTDVTEEFVLEAAYWILQEFRGRGFAAEALRYLAEYGQTTLGADGIFAYIQAGNEASRRTAAAAGMREVSRFCVNCNTNTPKTIEKWGF